MTEIQANEIINLLTEVLTKLNDIASNQDVLFNFLNILNDIFKFVLIGSVVLLLFFLIRGFTK